jgi:hypothetical protein
LDKIWNRRCTVDVITNELNESFIEITSLVSLNLLSGMHTLSWLIEMGETPKIIWIKNKIRGA